ncbi:hypothetical protein CBS101457_006652 [Exobasidium rhododendri]|nr:hypothetical protein CBS101457_006652 [Exobasidium rhododendri]
MEQQLLQAIDIAQGGGQGSNNPSIAQEALVYLEQVKQNTPQVWQPAWNIFAARNESTSRPLHSQAQRFFCISLVASFLEDSLVNYADPSSAVAYLQTEALKFFDDEYVAGFGEDGTSYMTNKFAQFLSSLLIQTYALPQPFTLLPNLLARMRSIPSSTSTSTLNPVSTDLVLRLLLEVSLSLGSDVTLRAIRSRERIARDTAIRDEIRSSHAVNIAESVWKIIEDGLSKVEEFRHQGGLVNSSDMQGWNLANSIKVTCEATRVMGDYVSWIDIGLVVTPQTISLLYRLLQHNEPTLRTASSDALLGIVSKGMKGTDKIEILQGLNLTSTVSELEKGTRRAKGQVSMPDEEITFREHLAKLANGVAMELARVLDDEKTDGKVRSIADEMLLTHMGLVLDFLTDEWDELAEAVLPCITITLSIYKKLKRTVKAAISGTPIPPSQMAAIYTPEKADFLARLMGILLIKMKFDDETEWNGGGGIENEGQDDEDDDDDDEDEDVGKFLQLRKQLQQNAAAIAAIDEQIFHVPTQRLILETLNACDAYLSNTGPPITWQQAELALFALYFCGEIFSTTAQGQVKAGVNASSFVHLPPDVTKAMRNKPVDGYFIPLTLNSLGEIAQRFFQSNISAFRHAAVQLQYFECSVRYAAFFTARPESLGDALAPYLDWRGIHHERSTVRHRVDYLFLRFIKDTKDQFRPNFVQGILEGMQDVLVVSAKLPSVEPNEDPLEKAVNKSSGFDHQLHLFEACGVVLRLLKNSPNDQVVLLKIIVDPLSKQLNEAVQQHQANKGDLQVILQIHHLFFALSNLAKGFPELNGHGLSKGEETPLWMNVFKVVTEQILSCLGVGSLNNYKIIRDAARGAFSRIVATTGLVILPYIPSLLNALLSQISAGELMDFLSFLGLVVNKYKTDVEAVFDELLTPLLEKTFYFLNQEVAGTDDQIQRQHLIRGYVAFLSTLISVNLDGVLRSERNQPQLETILQSLVFYAANSEASTVRTIFNILTRIVNLWGGRVSVEATTNKKGSLDKAVGEKPLPGFENFIYKTLVNLIFEVPGKPDFDFADAQTQIALTEICNLAKAIYAKRGQEFIDFLTKVYFPSINCPAEMANDFVVGLQTQETKQFRKYLEVSRLMWQDMTARHV